MDFLNSYSFQFKTELMLNFIDLLEQLIDSVYPFQL